MLVFGAASTFSSEAPTLCSPQKTLCYVLKIKPSCPQQRCVNTPPLIRFHCLCSSRNPLKFTLQGVSNIQLYPDAGEAIGILNIKRGIVSALMVPDMEDQQGRRTVSV